MRIIILASLLLTFASIAGEPELRKAGVAPFPLPLVGAEEYIGYSKDYDYNKWLYSLSKTAVGIYGNSAKSEEEKTKEEVYPHCPYEEWSDEIYPRNPLSLQLSTNQNQTSPPPYIKFHLQFTISRPPFFLHHRTLCPP